MLTILRWFNDRNSHNVASGRFCAGACLLLVFTLAFGSGIFLKDAISLLNYEYPNNPYKRFPNKALTLSKLEFHWNAGSGWQWNRLRHKFASTEVRGEIGNLIIPGLTIAFYGRPDYLYECTVTVPGDAGHPNGVRHSALAEAAEIVGTVSNWSETEAFALAMPLLQSLEPPYVASNSRERHELRIKQNRSENGTSVEFSVYYKE